MRVDYGFYVVAVICFIIAALPYMNVISQEFLSPSSFPSTALTVVFAALGLISIILGYSMRPKPIISIREPPEPAPPPSEPAPLTPPQEETAKPERKKTQGKTRRKKTRGRKEKA